MRSFEQNFFLFFLNNYFLPSTISGRFWGFSNVAMPVRATDLQFSDQFFTVSPGKNIGIV
jgi:hypothetical protein